eukprot:UN15638
MEEFWRQGDTEKKKKLPVSALCDREKTSVASSQVAFIKFIVCPWFEKWRDYLGVESEPCVEILTKNHQKYIEISKKEDTEKRMIQNNSVNKNSKMKSNIMLNKRKSIIDFSIKNR